LQINPLKSVEEMCGHSNRFIINAITQLDQEDARELSVVEPVIEGLQAIELVPDRVGDLGRLAPGHHLHVRWQEASHALLPKPAG
jgi:hypothetical protein